MFCAPCAVIFLLLFSDKLKRAKNWGEKKLCSNNKKNCGIFIWIKTSDYVYNTYTHSPSQARDFNTFGLKMLVFNHQQQLI